jgi:hypothetical protein
VPSCVDSPWSTLTRGPHPPRGIPHDHSTTGLPRASSNRRRRQWAPVPWSRWLPLPGPDRCSLVAVEHLSAMPYPTGITTTKSLPSPPPSLRAVQPGARRRSELQRRPGETATRGGGGNLVRVRFSIHSDWPSSSHKRTVDPARRRPAQPVDHLGPDGPGQGRGCLSQPSRAHLARTRNNRDLARDDRHPPQDGMGLQDRSLVLVFIPDLSGFLLLRHVVSGIRCLRKRVSV